MNMFGQKNIDLSTAGSIPTPESPYYDFRFPPRNNDNTRIFQTGPPGRMQLRGYEISGIAAWKRLKNNRTQGPGNLRIKTSDSLPSLPITSADKWMDELVHDLRNSTAAITAGMDLLRGNPDNFTSPRDQKIAEMMSRNTKKLKSYTQSLLNSSASQCRSGKPAGFDSCELVRLLSNCFDTLKAQYPVRIVFDTGGQGSINGIWRTEPLERAIDNLLSNAAKFGDGTVRVRVHQVNGSTTLRVQNYGRLIKSRDLKKIFDSGYRCRNTVKRPSGWGLGLALVSRVALAHKGNISVQSNRKQGTEFHLSLPTIPGV